MNYIVNNKVKQLIIGYHKKEQMEKIKYNKPKSIYQLSKAYDRLTKQLNDMKRPEQTSRMGIMLRNMAYNTNQQMVKLIKEAEQRAVDDNFEKYYIVKRNFFVRFIQYIFNL